MPLQIFPQTKCCYVMHVGESFSSCRKRISPENLWVKFCMLSHRQSMFGHLKQFSIAAAKGSDSRTLLGPATISSLRLNTKVACSQQQPGKDGEFENRIATHTNTSEVRVLNSNMESARKGEQWAEGFLICSTGLHRPIKEDVATVVTRAGGK